MASLSSMDPHGADCKCFSLKIPETVSKVNLTSQNEFQDNILKLLYASPTKLKLIEVCKAVACKEYHAYGGDYSTAVTICLAN